ncbi:unnamed protein product [Darwinula stevensoni]|uniref:F-box domain-containing protein n=1 Tax=Darwinula stevensoni TaxID=69355 RepID=A0A7R8ZZW9_9CRUS|nr:unnamed protein product [Darwinula stevensoni]CAG0883395.1 unnamed protein product [Darwinula stevensoni]
MYVLSRGRSVPHLVSAEPLRRFLLHADDEQDMVDMVENEGSGDVHERDLLRRGSLIRPPFCPITLKCTREVAGFNKLSEALKRLDFKSGIRDIRRFNYISRLMELLIVQNLTNLSGCAQRVLLNMLEEVTHHVAVSQTNIHILQKLVEDLRKTLYEYYCWGRPIGSTALWSQHWQTIDRIAQAANAIQIQPPDEDLIPKFGDLPPECVREILLRLACHKDLENAGRACDTMGSLVEEQRMWEPLCHFHFSPQQIAFAMKQLKIEDPKQCDWKILYHKLKRYH